MAIRENVLVQLGRLQTEGSLPRSGCSAALLETLRPLIDAGIVVEKRSGAGKCLWVENPAAFSGFVEAQFPDLSVDLPSRMQGVAQFRDSKVFPANTPEIVTVRAWRQDVLFKNGSPVDAKAHTAQHGLFSFLLREEREYNLRGRCALVENPAVFSEFERLRLPAALAICSRGRCSNRLIEWLAGNTNPDFHLLHLPDYDPVGLGDFVRLRERLGARVELYLPDDLAERFARFSNPGLLSGLTSQALLARLRETSIHEVRKVLNLIETHNAGLEQEALFIEIAGEG